MLLLLLLLLLLFEHAQSAFTGELQLHVDHREDACEQL